MTDQTVLLLIGAAVLLALLVLLLLRSRRQRVRLGESRAAPLAPHRPDKRTFAPPPVASPAPAPVPAEGDGVADEAVAAVENVVGQLLGIDAHHDRALDPEPQPADDLTQIKGLGAKAAASLATQGITRFDQLAALTAAEVTAVDARMGPLAGRITRDRWVEQAALLATGDRAGFEAAFGKLGS